MIHPIVASLNLKPRFLGLKILHNVRFRTGQYCSIAIGIYNCEQSGAYFNVFRHLRPRCGKVVVVMVTQLRSAVDMKVKHYLAVYCKQLEIITMSAEICTYIMYAVHRYCSKSHSISHQTYNCPSNNYIRFILNIQCFFSYKQHKSAQLPNSFNRGNLTFCTSLALRIIKK